MEVIEAKILLKNLLKRVSSRGDGIYVFDGLLTDDEFEALQLALVALDGGFPEQSSAIENVISPSKPVQADVSIDYSVLDLPEAPKDRRLCIDFGTAMSKVTLVRDRSTDRDYEEVDVLQLGVPGDQEQISETMLVSSVFIDQGGLLWFGQKAVELSKIDAGSNSGARQRLDNIKRFLSEEGLESKVNSRFNPTDFEITYSDMVLAYLTFLAWTVGNCLDGLGETRNLQRRFAMPCLDSFKSRDVAHKLRVMLGQAQILADTFSERFGEGIKLSDFLHASSQLQDTKQVYDFVTEDVTEPLGVAGAIMSWEKPVNALLMVVDIGAGTSDFSLYRMRYDNMLGESTALEVENSSEGITEAGNYLDKLLRGLILKQAGITSDHEHWINIQDNLELDLRDYKERLFEDEHVTVRLFNDQLVEVSLNDFLDLEQVEGFGVSLRECRDRILHRVDSSFVNGAPNNAVAIVLTGGGAGLPMVRELAKGTVNINGKQLSLVQGTDFPRWLEEDYPELESIYARISVSLGGARKKVVDRGGVATLTAGDVKAAPVLQGYYTKGN